MQKEAQARIKINKLLEEAGWRFFDNEKGQANIQLESGVNLTKTKVDALGNDFETETEGYVDYLLLDDEGHPIIVVEAKKEAIHPLGAKEQARDYAYSKRCRFVVLSNGNTHYFWDTETGNPQIITEFPTLSSLYHRKEFKPDKEKLAEEIVDYDYLARIKNKTFDRDPRYIDESTRAEFIKAEKLVILRPFQISAIHALQRSARDGQERYLFEMATGTGKTLTTAAICRLFLKTGNAKRILFLVDRIELERQAKKALEAVLGIDYIIKIFKRNRDNWKSAQIVISTVQSLLSGDKYRKEFSPTDFELVISDEAHRSLGGNSRAVFEYFNGYKLGLTATPKNYLKNVKNQNDPRAMERREMLDTYKTFGCHSSEPTFRYSLLDGVKDGYLVNPKVIDARTDVTTELLSQEGYAVMVIDEQGNETEETFSHRQFEKRFFNEETNVAFCKAFIENAKLDPISNELGKSLVFCVSQAHARKITQILNEMAHQAWQGKYNSDFAMQITSLVKEAQDKTTQFSNDRLGGVSQFKEGYKTSKTRVAVTVGMMTTGYDCSDILNVAFMRPVFSPADFVQMKGRGTRLHTFSFSERNYKKDNFLLFDFFGNYQYFEHDFKYDEELKLPAFTGGVIGDGETPLPPIEVDIKKMDKMITKDETELDEKGMRVDRELYLQKFEEAIKGDGEVQTVYEQEGAVTPLVEEAVHRHVMNKPSEYFTPKKLRGNIIIDRWVSFKELLQKAFGEIDEFKSLNQKIEDEFDKFQDIEELDADLVPSAKWLFSAYLQDRSIRDIIESREYGRLNAMSGVDIQAFQKLATTKRNGYTYAQYIPAYIHDYVGNIKEFERV